MMKRIERNNKNALWRAMMAVGLALILMTGAGILSGCAGDGQGSEGTEQVPASRDFFAMDTYMTVTAYGEHAPEATEAAEAEVTRLDNMLSTGNAESQIGALNQAGKGTVSEEVAALVTRGLELYEQTGHKFDIAIYPIMQAWGFPDKNYRVPSEEELQELLLLTDAAEVTVASGQTDAAGGDDSETATEVGDSAAADDDGDGAAADGDGTATKDDSAAADDDGAADALRQVPVRFGKKGMAIDLGGIAKGYTSSRIMEIYREHGVASGLVSLGGNVQVLGTKPDGSLWKVAVQDPGQPSEEGGQDTGAASEATYLGVLEVADTAVITSGAYERNFTENGVLYHHIIDPATGRPADSGLKSVTIVSEDGTLADALSTSLYIMGKDEAIAFWRAHQEQFNCILMDESEELYVTEPIADHFSSDAYHVTVVK